MATLSPLPADRASFNRAIADVLADHATLRHLAASAAGRTGYSADDTLSLADALAAHERTEARLFELPFLTRTPAAVVSSAARARQRCVEYTSGNLHRRSSSAAAAEFVEALLEHLTAEETWLAHEKEQKNQRLWTSI